MGYTLHPNGISSMGMPIVGGAFLTTGTLLFVHSVSGSNGNTGLDSSHPLATIEYAFSKCTASVNDYIIGMPGHAETVSSAGALDCDVIGVTVLGIGEGTIQPTITLDSANTADIDIDAASITFENIHFKANYADIAGAIDVNSTDFTVRNCRFSQTADDMNAKVWIQDDGSTGAGRIKIEGCQVSAYDASNLEFVAFDGTGDGHIVRNNFFAGDWGTACISAPGVITRAQITHNFIINAATDTDSCIEAAATATGLIAWNGCGGGAAQGNGIVANGMGKIENYYVDLSDASGLLEPAAT